jgi:uncharacterized protein YjiS (DUF1127 family)
MSDATCAVSEQRSTPRSVGQRRGLVERLVNAVHSHLVARKQRRELSCISPRMLRDMGFDPIDVHGLWASNGGCRQWWTYFSLPYTRS